MKHLADILTASRIVSAVVMLLFPVDLLSFWGRYVWCGLSDMIDGAAARKYESSSMFGAWLDSAADAVFVIVCFVKLLPTLLSSPWLIAWIVLIGLCKIAALIVELTRYRRVASLHTTANKVAGFAIFLSASILYFSGCALLALPACAIATFAAMNEAHLIWHEKLS